MSRNTWVPGVSSQGVEVEAVWTLSIFPHELSAAEGSKLLSCVTPGRWARPVPPLHLTREDLHTLLASGNCWAAKPTSLLVLSPHFWEQLVLQQGEGKELYPGAVNFRRLFSNREMASELCSQGVMPMQDRILCMRIWFWKEDTFVLYSPTPILALRFGKIAAINKKYLRVNLHFSD